MPGPAPATLTFSTRHLPPLSRHRALHELSEQGLLPVVPLADRTPRVDLVKWRLPGVSVLSGRFGGVRQCGEPEPAGAAPGGPAELFVGINVAGDSLARQQRREVGIGAGDAVVIDPGGGAFTVLRPGPCRLIGLRVPRHTVPSACGAGQPPLRLVPADTAALQLLTRYLGSILAGPPPSGQLTDAVVAHLTELIELSLLTPGSGALPARDRGVRAARHYPAVPAQAVRGRRHDLQPVCPGAAPRPRLPQAPRPAPGQPYGQLDRPPRRLRRPVVLQPDVPPPVRGHAVGCPRASSGLITWMGRG
jgi:hypothetical protein